MPLPTKRLVISDTSALSLFNYYFLLPFAFLATTYGMRETFDNLPSEFIPFLLESYFSSEVIVCDFSFPRYISERMRKNPDAAADLLASCLYRIARKYKIEFRTIITGNLSRLDRQIHFHLWILAKGAGKESLDGISKGLQERWAFLANGRHRPSKRRLSEGYSRASTIQDWMESFSSNGEEPSELDKMSFKLSYNLNLDKNDWLWTESDKIGTPEKVYSYRYRKTKI